VERGERKSRKCANKNCTNLVLSVGSNFCDSCSLKMKKTIQKAKKTPTPYTWLAKLKLRKGLRGR